MTRDLERRVSRLERDIDRPIPVLFRSWGRQEGLDDEEIRAEWENVVNATASGDDPIGTAWKRSLNGELFDHDIYR